MNFINVLPNFAPSKRYYYLKIFEKQMKLLNVSPDFWVPHLIKNLSNNICKLVACKDKEIIKKYSLVHNILLP